MRATKKTVSISEELVNEVSAMTSNFSAVVEIALREYMQHYRIKKAMGSFGKWQERKGSSVNLINKIRQETCRKYADRNN